MGDTAVDCAGAATAGGALSNTVLDELLSSNTVCCAGVESEATSVVALLDAAAPLAVAALVSAGTGSADAVVIGG